MRAFRRCGSLCGAVRVRYGSNVTGSLDLRPPLSRSPQVSLQTRIVTPRLVLRAPRTSDVADLRRHLRENAEHLRPWNPSPVPGEDPVSLTSLSAQILRQRRQWKRGEAYVLFVTARDERGTRDAREPLLGRVAFTGVVRGVFQNAYLGYWMDARNLGRGLMTEAVHAALRFAFEDALLHRVQAAIMPHNAPSLRVAEKLGFRYEGDAPRYLFIGGDWQLHRIFAMTYEEFRARERKSVSG